MTTLPGAARRRIIAAGVVYLYGGSFDPPHAYHALAPGFADPSGAAPCVYVPAARSPFKDKGPAAADADRVAMLRAMLRGRRHAVVWTDEIDRAARLRASGAAAPSYTIDTVRRLRTLLGDRVHIRLVIGADQAVEFHRWRSARTLVRLADPVVLPRQGVVRAAQLIAALRNGTAGAFWSAAEIARWGSRLLDAPIIRESSTGVRRLLGGTPAERARGLRRLPAPVARLVKARRLYERTQLLSHTAA